MVARPTLRGLPELVITDIDGVWTDGGMYYDRAGNELKKFNTSDSAGVLFLRSIGIPLAIITGEDTEMVSARAAKLRIDYVLQGTTDKLKAATDLCDRLGTSLAKTAFIGDDLMDIRLLSRVGLSGCPANGPLYVKNLVDIVTDKQGGDGAFREFVERFLRQAGKLQDVIDSVLGESLSELTQGHAWNERR